MKRWNERLTARTGCKKSFRFNGQQLFTKLFVKYSIVFPAATAEGLNVLHYDLPLFRDNLAGVVGGGESLELNLRLLRQIESLVDNMQSAQSSSDNLIKLIRATRTALTNSTNSFVVDPDNKISDQLWDLAEKFKSRSESIADADRALDHDKEMVSHPEQLAHIHHCVAMLMKTLLAVEEEFRDLRASLIENDMGSEKRDPREFDTVSGLIDALRE